MQHIRSLVRQAALYRAQGLYTESRAKYEEILSLLGSTHRFQNVEKLADAIRKRLENVEWDIQMRDLRDKVLERSEIADYWELSDDRAGNLVSWTRNAVSWTRKRITKRRLPGELPGKKRIWS
jgi:hypothetical protein